MASVDARAATWLRYVERALIVVSIFALGWYAGVRTMATVYQASAKHQLEQMRGRSGNDAASLGLSRLLSRPQWGLASQSLVGKLEVPRLRLSVMIREGTEPATLRRAVGHIPGTALPGEDGNAAVTGHRDTFFRSLKDAEKGDRIIVTTPNGEFDYVVRETRIVAPTDVWVLDPTPQPTLTLLTCYPFYYVSSAPDRYIVRATLDPASRLISSESSAR